MVRILILILFIILSLEITAQSLSPSVISSLGDYHEGESASLSWTLGEVVIETVITETIILTQGFQQSKISTTNAIERLVEDYHIKVYPNPASQLVLVEFTKKKPERIILDVFDQNGKLLSQKRIEIFEKAAEVDFGKYVPAKYFLRIRTPDNQLNITYPIIKQ